MAAAVNMPDIKSGKILQISELDDWAPDEVHGNSVRVLGRVLLVDIPRDTILIEYHGKQLEVNGNMLGDCGQFRVGTFFQFLGELERREEKFILNARISRNMTGLDTDLYDRCLKFRRNFEKEVIEMRESNRHPSS